MSLSRAARADNVLMALFALFLFSSAFSIALSQISLAFSLAVFLGILIARRENPLTGALAPLYVVIGLYVSWMLISPLAGATPWKSFLMEREDWLFAVIPIGVYLMAREECRKWLLVALGAGLLLVSIYGSVQHFTGLHWPRTDLPTLMPNGRFSAEGTFANKLTYSNYLATGVAFLLGWVVLERRKWWNGQVVLFGLAVLAGMTATVLSYGRTAAATLPIAALVTAGLRGRRWLFGGLAAVAVIVPLTVLLVPGVAGRYQLALSKDLAGENETARTHIWGKSLAIALENPVFGVGHGHFPENYAKQNDTARGEHRVFPHAHNDLLTAAAVTGFPGAALFVAMWGVVVGLLLRARRLSERGSEARGLAGAALVGSVAFLLCSVTEATFFDEEVRQLLMFVWAAGLWPLANKKALQAGSPGIRGEVKPAKTT